MNIGKFMEIYAKGRGLRDNHQGSWLIAPRLWLEMKIGKEVVMCVMKGLAFSFRWR